MRAILSPEQIRDLLELDAAAKKFQADVVIIGATALSCFFDDIGRYTNDVDLVIALDLEDFKEFSGTLASSGWVQEPKREHRWHSPRGSRIDLLPAGPGLRRAGKIMWPQSQFEMSLAGFDHVFKQAICVEFAKDIKLRVAPPVVVAILKIVAHLDDPQRRAKDLLDIKTLLRSYDAASDRIFIDEVFAAELEDIEYANAFLLGLDLNRIATPQGHVVMHSFVNRYRTAELERLDPVDDREEIRFQLQLKAFEKGIGS